MTADRLSPLDIFFGPHRKLFVRQQISIAQRMTGLEMPNRYTLHGSAEERLGAIREKVAGHLGRVRNAVLGQYRPYEFELTTPNDESVLVLRQRSRFFCTALNVLGHGGAQLGQVQRRTSSIGPSHYDLVDSDGRNIAILGTRGHLSGRFSVAHIDDGRAANIARENESWVGAMFEDADTYTIDFDESDWIARHKAVVLAAVIALDLDYADGSDGLAT